MSKLIDLTGQRFGRLTVVGRPFNGGKQSRWNCKCDCGNLVCVASASLRSGRSNSCGCLRKEVTAKEKRKYQSGETETRLYKIWIGIKTRTGNPNVKSYKDYGERGIKLCTEWEADFEAFNRWALDNGYRNNLTIDRKDNDKGYSPDNCRWIRRADQNKNRRSNHYITYNGETRTLSEWSKALGIKRETLSRRLNQLHWSIEKAFNTI